MMKKQSIKLNYFLNTFYQLLSFITPLITAPYISRVLGADGVGTFSYTSSISAFFILFAVLGTTTYGQRTIAQCRDDKKKLSKTFWEIEILSIITTTVCLMAWVVFMLITKEYRTYYGILSISIFSVIFDIMWFYSGIEDYKSIVLKNTLLRVLSIGLIFVLVKKKEDLWLYFLIQSFSTLLGNLSMWIPLHNYICRIRISELCLKQHFKETCIYFLPTAAASVYSYLDKVMIGRITSSTVENGYYEQGQKILRMGYQIISSLNVVMAPRMSYLFAHKNYKEISDKLNKALELILKTSIPMAFGIAGIATNFVPWFFGEEFNKTTTIMMFGSPLVVILCLHNFLSSQFLIPSGQRARSTKGVFVGSGVNFCMNLILIPRYQSIGAIIATLIAELVICIIYIHMSKDYVPLAVVRKTIGKPLISSIFMFCIVTLVGNFGKNGLIIIGLQIVIGILSYVSLMILFKDMTILSLVKELSNKFKTNGNLR